MKRLTKILMASLLVIALTAVSVPALVAYARDGAIEGRGVIGWDDTIPSSSQAPTTTSAPPETTTSTPPTTTSGGVVTTTSSGDTTTSRLPDVLPPDPSGGGTSPGGGGGTTPGTTSYTPVRVTTSSNLGGTAGAGGAGTAAVSTTSIASRSSTSLASESSSMVEEELGEQETPVDLVTPNPTANIFGYDVALGGPRQIGGWSLFSLLMVVLGVLASLAFAIRNKTSGKGDKAMYLVSAFAAVPVLLFFILQDFTQMYVFNHLSPLFGVLFLVHVIALCTVGLHGRKKEATEEE